MNSNVPISEQYSRAAHDWADQDAAASMMEESKSSVLSQWMLATGIEAVNRAEANVKASQRWQQYIKDMVEARRKANHAKVEMEFLRMTMQEWIAADANNRVQARL